MIQRFRVGGMSCAACSAHVEKSVSAVPGVSGVQVNLLAGSMAVEYDENACDAQTIIKAVESGGYTAAVDDGRQTSAASTPDRDSALAPSGSAVELAVLARREYEALKMQNWGTHMGLTLISDLDGNGIPELILVTNRILDIQDIDGSVRQEPACVFSVYTYGESGLQTLISDWPTRCVIAGGNDLVIGADSRDGQPVVVALYRGETTSANFGDVGYEGGVDGLKHELSF